MRVRNSQAVVKTGALVACLSLFAAPVTLHADETSAPGALLATNTLSLMSEDPVEATAGSGSLSILLDNSAGLEFDLGESTTRKLQLQLNQPLTLSAGTTARALDSGGDLLGLDATLNVPLTDNFNLAAGIERQAGTARFHSLGSIHCMNGTLRADSYTASGCRFVNEPLASSEQKRFDLGAQMDFGKATASLGWFTQDSEIRQSGVRRLGAPGGQAVMGNSLLSPNLSNPLLSPNGYDPLQYLNTEVSGINLDFKVGIATDTSGDLRLGLAFSRVLDAGYEGLYSNAGDPLSWTIAEPFNTARMDFEWSRGAFSGGVQGYYRDSVDFLNRDGIDSLTTFDVYFTWRTPWNANLSVGASNVLNAGSEIPSSAENQPVDPFESIYGRIPYVRYKQDL